MTLSDEQLKAMKASAPLLVAEYRKLRHRERTLRKLIDDIKDGCMCDPSVAFQVGMTLRILDKP